MRNSTAVVFLGRSSQRAFAPVTLGLCYFLIAGATVASTRYGGGVACLWVATAALQAALSTTPRSRWPGLVAACGLASAVATGLWGLGWLAAVPMAAVNMAEGVLIALLIDRRDPRVKALDTLERVLVFCLAAGVAAPLASGLAGAAVASATSGTDYLVNLRNWMVGHGLGTITFSPLFMLVASGSARRWVHKATPRRIWETIGLLLVVLATTAAVFGQNTRPLLFLPILPVILVTFRSGRLGAAAAIAIVAIVGGWLTMHGLGPIHLSPGAETAHAQLFQFYLATTVLTALPVAADLARRRDVFHRLRDSEAQLRLLTEHSTDIVMKLKPDGTIRYASPSIAQLGGRAADAVVGRNALSLVVQEDRPAAQAAHRATLRQPDVTQTVEYRVRTADGAVRWFETLSRGVVDDEGRVTGAVCTIRDVSHRKAIETELVRVAETDPLTGIANRRAFDAELDRRIAAGAAGPVIGHVAIFDLDHFKAINDRHGHAAGDEVLRSFARIARGSVRDGDMVARLGGEEFGLVLGESSREQARTVCDRIRMMLAATTFRVAGASVAVTASAGVAALEAGGSPQAALDAADAALYRAKMDGRDRLRLAA